MAKKARLANKVNGDKWYVCRCAIGTEFGHTTVIVRCGNACQHSDPVLILTPYRDKHGRVDKRSGHYTHAHEGVCDLSSTSHFMFVMCLKSHVSDKPC